MNQTPFVRYQISKLDRLPLLEAYDRADDLLGGTQDGETVARLRACARRIVQTRRARLPPRRVRRPADFWAGFELYPRVRAYEARYIKRALIDAGGSVTRAARLLGVHYATLAAMLDENEGRHKDLAHLRTPPEPRRQSIMAGGRRRPREETESRTVRILHVEDNRMVADAVRDTLELEGRNVVACDDGATASKLLEGKERYDLLLFDNELPHVSGLELVRRARQLPHRRRTPTIMLSASDVEAEAWRAGVDAFLRKPDDVGRLAEMVTRLISGKK